MTIQPFDDPDSDPEIPSTADQLHVAIDEMLADIRRVLRLAVSVMAERLAQSEARDITRYAVVIERIERLMNDQLETNQSVANKLHQLANHAMGNEARIDEIAEFASINDEIMQVIIERVLPLLNKPPVDNERSNPDERSASAAE
jgi:CII-binding regulator of phage lambda lysogenization HflD